MKKTKQLIRVMSQKKSTEQLSTLNVQEVRNTAPIITANLHEACSRDTVNRSTVARWFK